MTKPTIGFIGQGWIGKNYADDFERRGFEVVRYSLEKEFIGNRDMIKDCRIVFIAVPTPTTPQGFDDSYVAESLKNLAPDSTAVIKSTILPGTTEKLQKAFPEIFITHSPEFLVEKTAAYDAAHPSRNIIGIPVQDDEYLRRANEVLSVLPEAPFKLVCTAKEAELIKYGANAFLFLKVVYANILYDIAKGLGCDYEKIREMVAADPRIGASHLSVSDDGGRGAGGHCFLKDFEAFIELHKKAAKDEAGLHALESWREKNINLLRDSNKNLDIIKEVYGQ